MSDFSDEDFSDSASDIEVMPKKTSKKSKTPSSESSRSSPTPSGATKNGVSASDQYQKLSQLEHILKRPDTYIGSVEKNEVEMWHYDQESQSMKFSKVTIVPGLYKIFDEILVNAADNKIRDKSMKNIKVDIDAEKNTISVLNDGRGIPVEIHAKEKIYIPEMIFGNLLTSSNYDDDQRKVTGGRNGFGAKLCNIFSTEFTVETSDQNTGLLYKQTWTDNMSKVTKPSITKVKNKKEFTKITFKPDLSKFNMDALDNDILAVLRRRVYDLCGTVKDCNIFLNDTKLSIKNFKAYVEMYVKAIQERSPDIAIESGMNNYTTIVHEVINDRWELAFAVSDGTFNQVSFVNSIATTTGGTHVKYVSDQIVQKLMDELNKGKKGKKAMIKPAQIKNNMFIFVNCLIENPAFTSQTKEQLTTRPSQFASNSKDKLIISDQFIKKLSKTSIVETIKGIVDANEGKALQKDDGKRKSRIKGQVKLVDANKAGTKEGYKCTLILTEGDSAKSLAVAGLSVVGRDYYGCFPLRGKLLNVREASTELISKNAEITALKQIIGLQHRKAYNRDNIKELRYGHVMIMTDQDHDGSHIKGLLINFFETSFPGLLNIDEFLLEFITPIVKVTVKARGRGNEVKIPFYSMPEFEQWRETEGKTVRWRHKYYKGLGTSSAAEAREYFSKLDKHLKYFHALQDDDSSLIELAFSKKKADERKEWLQGFQPGTYLDSDLSIIPISDFINQELILFSMADNIRSIPSVLDGFKPGQRKVLFGCFKKNLKNEMKVVNLCGYISNSTGYHHGDSSLIQTIIGMAQNFIGSNNLNLLKPNGGFGTRAAGGKDFSAARYIFTELNEITRKVFNPLDDPLYNYLQEDEQTVEPEWYLPVLPMLLVNGAEGIGTGWSTNVPSFNPLDLVHNIKRLMNGLEPEELVPWYRGWEGEVHKIGDGKFKILGRIEQIDDKTLEITEIPVKSWTDNVKEFLLDGVNSDKNAWIKDMEEQHGANVKFIIKLSQAEMTKSLQIGLLERFKLTATVNLSNMVAFDPLGRIKKYESPNEILKDFYYVRLEYYQKRKDFMTEDLQNQLLRLSEQARFIKLIIDREMSISNKKRAVLVDQLINHKFARFDKHGRKIEEQEGSELFVEADEALEEEEEEVGDVSRLNARGLNDLEQEDEAEHRPENIYTLYDYLLGMSLWSLTRERYERLLKQKVDKENELNVLLGKSAKDLWNEDLEAFVISWEKFLDEDEKERNKLIPGAGVKSAKKRRRKVKDEDDDEDYGARKKRAAPKAAAKPQAPKKRNTDLATPPIKDEPSDKPAGANDKLKKQSQLPFIKKETDSENKSPASEKSSTTDSLPDDNLPTFFKKQATPPKPQKKTGGKKRSFFDEDSDDDIIVRGNKAVISENDESENESSTNNQASKPKAASKRSAVPPQEVASDSDDDLVITNESNPPARRNKKAVSYKVDDLSESEEEDDVDEEIESDDDDNGSDDYVEED